MFGIFQSKKNILQILIWVIAFLFTLLPLSYVFADNYRDKPFKTNEQVYQNPFDLAAGGASLTRATQEGVIFANPSLTAFGAGFIRWIFLRSTLHIGADASDLGYAVARKKISVANPNVLIDKILQTPMLGGLDLAGGAIFSNGGFVAFSSSRIDLEGRQFGNVGVPELRIRAYSTNGIGAIGSAELIKNTLVVGFTSKVLYNLEQQKIITLSDITNIQQTLQTTIPEDKKKLFGLGFGQDIATTLQKRTKNLDFRLAAVVTDVGNTKFTNDLPTWKQNINIGLGVTLHNRNDAIHCAIDEHDLLGVYEEHWTRKTYTGCKALFNGRFGAGAGFYQGWPTFGVVLNLTFIRLELGTYTKELGKQVGTLGRRMYFISLGGEYP